MRFTGISRKLTALLLAMALLAASAGAESFSAIVTSRRMNVYADTARTWRLGSLPRTAVVTVEEYADGTAKISLDGRTGYAAVADMKALEALATPAVVNCSSRVYQWPDLSSRWLRLASGTRLNLLAVNGRWAMVERDGNVAYTNRAHLTVIEESVEAPEQPTEPEQPGGQDELVEETFIAVVTADRMPVYRSASDASEYLGSVGKGTQVTVHAYRGGWAYLELDGRRGFAQIAHMERLAEDAPVETPEEAPADDYINNPDYTVRQVVAMFLAKEMALNKAVVSGIMANIEKESSFRVTAASYDGGYGLIQWTGSRNTRLKTWCKNNSYNYATLEGQLWYLKYELENHYPKILNHLRTIENTPAGAYDAGHYFCYHFEVPANRAARSVERGNLAKSLYLA